MTTSKKLLMVTTSYPYGQAESFVTAELEHIAPYFDEIELVPSYFAPHSAPRPVGQAVNLAYATKRWGVLRKLHVTRSFFGALVKYRWFDEAVRIARHAHRVENVKELARALYRARLFERFLEAQFVEHGKAFDVIYFYWMVPEIMGAIGFRQSSRLPMKIVARAHGGDLYEDRKAGGYAGLRDAIAAGIDDIYCISGHGKAYLDQRYPALAQKFHTARLGVNDPGYLNEQPDDTALSIVSCSFVVEGKRLHLIVEALEYLLDRDPAIKLRWTHIGDGELYDQLRALAHARLRDRAQVVFTGYLTQPQVASLYRQQRFDVVVNVSDCEGIPVSLMEASSAGIPMLATDVGGNGEIVNAHNGILIAADADVRTIACALARFADRPLAGNYRRAARSTWDARFNARVNYNRFGQQLAGLAAPRAHVA
ncbi:MAG: glycosyltransferase [Pseudomonadota bacterium]|nr:glycosyltransferase [Pseudomonadota bacterium]